MHAAAFDLLAKVLVIGDSGVGKTCLLLRFCDKTYMNSHLATIGVDFKTKIIEVEEKKIKITVWDTAGQDRFKTITESFYKNSMGVLLTYAVDDEESFENIESWMRQINEKSNEDICKILVGNKSDSKKRVIEYDKGKELAEKYGIKFF